MIPLHRLMPRHEVEALLGTFGSLLPGATFALITPEGKLFAGSEIDSSEPGSNNLQVEVAGQVLALLSANSVGAPLLPALCQSLAMLFESGLEKREIARETLDRYREINLLYQTAETIGSCLNADEIPALVINEAMRVLPAATSMVLLRTGHGEGKLETSAVFPKTGSPTSARPEQDTLPSQLLAASQTLLDHVLSSSRPDIHNDQGIFSSTMGAPLKSRERVLGVVLLGRLADEPSYTAGDEKLLTALATQAGIAIEKAWLHQQELQRQKMEQELVLGQRIQRSLLPPITPHFPGWEFAAFYQAARQVGGDFYDFYTTIPAEPAVAVLQTGGGQAAQGDQATESIPVLATGSSRLAEKGGDSTSISNIGLLIADVTGKGVPAALMMAFSRAILSTVLRTNPAVNYNPAEMLRQVNRFIVRDNRTGLLLTALYASLDPLTGQIWFANGGHERPVLRRAATGECTTLDSRGVLLGAFLDVALEERQEQLESGDLLVFYTDGISEARSSSGELFGEERLLTAIEACQGLSAEASLQKIMSGIRSFTSGTDQSDDYTLLVVKRQ